MRQQNKMSAFLLWIDFFQLLLITGVHTVHHHFRSGKEEVMEDIIHQGSSCNSSNESINSKGKYMYISVYCLNSSSATLHSKKNHCHLTQLNKHKLVHSVELTSVKYHTNSGSTYGLTCRHLPFSSGSTPSQVSSVLMSLR